MRRQAFAEDSASSSTETDGEVEGRKLCEVGCGPGLGFRVMGIFRWFRVRDQKSNNHETYPLIGVPLVGMLPAVSV